MNAGSRVGPYVLLAPLGRGGMGVVWKVRDERTGELAALKLLAPELAHDLELRDRARRELEAVRSVVHPNVVKVRDAAPDASYIVFELVTGGSLAERLRQARQLRWREAARLGAQIARALAAAHAAGVIHRDVKPANVLLDERGAARLSDFGLVRAVDGRSLTLSGEGLGTAGFSAPEQLEGARGVGPSADLYALGATLHALVAGEPPFGEGAPLTILNKQQREAPRPLRELVPATPPELERLVLALLSVRPEDRPSSAAAVAETLEAIASGKPARRRRVAAGLAFVLGAALVAPLAFFVLPGRSVRQGAPTPLPAAGAPRAAPAPPSPPPEAPPPPPPAPRRVLRAAPSRESFHAKPIRAVALLRGADGQPEVASAGDDGRIVFWTALTGQHRRTRRREEPVRALAFHSVGVYAFATPTKVVAVWRRTPGAEPVTREWLTGSPALALIASERDDSFMVGGAQEKGEVEWWVWGQEEATSFPGQFLKPKFGVSSACLTFTKEGRPVGIFGYDNSRVDVRSILDGGDQRALEVRMSDRVPLVASSVVLHRFVAADASGLVRIFGVRDDDAGLAIEPLHDHRGPPATALAMAPEGGFALVGHGDGSVVVVGLRDRAPITLVEPGELGSGGRPGEVGTRVEAIAIGEDGTYAAIAVGSRLSVWAVKAGICAWRQEP